MTGFYFFCNMQFFILPSVHSYLYIYDVLSLYDVLFIYLLCTIFTSTRLRQRKAKKIRQKLQFLHIFTFLQFCQKNYPFCQKKLPVFFNRLHIKKRQYTVDIGTVLSVSLITADEETSKL